MSEWIHLEIPAKMVGETIESGNGYIQTYRTEILLPKNSQYAGYCFQHPSKLVSCGHEFAKLTYNETFSFTLVKKDREPGKRYKRFKLTAAEIVDIYAPEVTALKTKLAKKEEKRLTQIGTVEVCECRGSQISYWAIIFRYNNKLYNLAGKEFSFFGDIHNSKVIATDVPRRVLEAAATSLYELCDNYKIVLDVRHTLNQGVNPKSSDKTVEIYDSLYSVSDQ